MGRPLDARDELGVPAEVVAVDRSEAASQSTVGRFFHAHWVRRGDQIDERWSRVQVAVDPVSEPTLVEHSMFLVQALSRPLQAVQSAID